MNTPTRTILILASPLHALDCLPSLDHLPILLLVLGTAEVALILVEEGTPLGTHRAWYVGTLRLPSVYLILVHDVLHLVQLRLFLGMLIHTSAEQGPDESQA